MREIILDTETTGFDPDQGDRIVEIGCVETQYHIATGETFHVYVNPERDMPEGAFGVHGLSEEFLSDKPVFAEVVENFLTFIGGSPLVIHNAEFDMKFLNSELKKIGRPLLDQDRSIDTVAMARRKFPGAQANLDALCRRFDVDLSRREKHGALLDAELLAEVYLQLCGGLQPGLELTGNGAASDNQVVVQRQARVARAHAPSPEELAAHAALVEVLREPVWTSKES
ncbi:MAG: DNA polymerase III subunit epsilon [Alphaproteobacteria bacterium]|nr:DNA polymerase III subunit epsilon [Alphaproteobacteria bacterium]